MLDEGLEITLLLFDFEFLSLIKLDDLSYEFTVSYNGIKIVMVTDHGKDWKVKYTKEIESNPELKESVEDFIEELNTYFKD